MAKRVGWVGVQSIEFMGQTGRGSKRVIFKQVNRVGLENSDPFCHVYLSLYALVHSPNMPKPASPIQFSSCHLNWGLSWMENSTHANHVVFRHGKTG